MTTLTIKNPSNIVSREFDTERDLYQYLVDSVIDLDIREHDISEFDQKTQERINLITLRPMNSFINI